MAKTVEYEGYTIQSAPHYQTDREKWRLRIFISFEDHRGVRTREFSSDVLYATEQEADIHGTTFGQRLIDGKVEGQSVMDMKTPDRRAMPRLRVQFRTTFSGSTKLEGTGVMLDLSTGGCRIASPVTVEPGVSLELRIYAPDFRAGLLSDHGYGTAAFGAGDQPSDGGVEGVLNVPTWMTYKNHQIKVCPQHLVDDRWMPMALAWMSAGSLELLQHIHGELSEICSTEKKANDMALEKAKDWVDQQSIG